MSTHNIGVDMISEILSRSSLQTIGKCRLLSKECNSLTYESNFTQLHSQRTKTVRGFFIQSSKKQYTTKFVSIENPDSKLSLNFLPHPVEILASTNQGLLLCKSTNYEHRRIPRFYVCKPLTREWQQIPNPKTRYFTERIAMMVVKSNNSLRYKIMRISDHSKFCNRRQLFYYGSFRCDIFDSETWKWKQLKDIYLPREELFTFRPAISVCGAFHWLTTEDNIFSFNVIDETWTMLSLPEHLDLKNLKMELAEYEGKLALVCEESENYDGMALWVMDNYSKRIWSKRPMVTTKPLEKEYRFVPGFVAFCNADVAFMGGRIFYNFKLGTYEEVELEYMGGYCNIFTLQSDVEPSNLSFRKLEKQSRNKKQQKASQDLVLLDLDISIISPAYILLWFCFFLYSIVSLIYNLV